LRAAVAEPTRLAVLGSTGSIGRQSLDVVRRLGGRFDVRALGAGRDARLLSEQAAELRPAVVHLADEQATRALDLPAGVAEDRSADALERMATREDVDIVVVATGGVVSLRPVLAALAAGKVVATANKETLVSGGHLVMPLARRLAGDGGSPLDWLRPIDSEHSAIWQCLAGERMADVARLILTASGGPFRTWPAERLAAAAPSDALAHPTWNMGAKITIDSATLVNKGLEVIEARWLYDVPDDRIDVVVHPQSIVHSLVEFADGSLKAQLGLPDMRIPIQYALTHPARLPSPAPRLDAARLADLTFEAPDTRRFPGLAIARDAGRRGPRASAALIAADEVAVARFLEGRLDFPGIAAMLGDAVHRFDSAEPPPGIDELLELDLAVREWAATARAAAAS
jgi:1-deoxy-D-xylulose-5-phosphate reductoisomerase